MSILAFLIVAWVVTYIGALAYWINGVGSDFEGVFFGALWSILVALIFPLVWFGVLIALLVRAVQSIVDAS